MKFRAGEMNLSSELHGHSGEYKQKYEELNSQIQEVQSNFLRATEKKKTVELEYKSVKRQVSWK